MLNALLDSRFTANFDSVKNIAGHLSDTGSYEFSESEWLSDKALRAAEKNISDALKDYLNRYFVADASITEFASFTVNLDSEEIRHGVAPKVVGNINTKRTISFDEKTSLECQFNLNGKWKFNLQGDLPTRILQGTINEVLMDFYCPARRGRAFLLPAERSGINLFFRELNSSAQPCCVMSQVRH